MDERVLKTDGLTKRFGALAACSEVSIDVRPGEIHALIGPNGAGKSTLIAQISGALRPDAGRVLLGGEDVTALSVPARAQRGLARTFQVSSLAMENSVLQNALLGALGGRRGYWRPAMAHADARQAAQIALERVGLARVAAQRVETLSHGQRRQLEVAIALTLQPRVFLMDEPMAGLGVEGSSAMTRLLDGLRAEAPILLVEHDMDAVFALADRISVLAEGRIIDSGTVAEIRASDAVRAAYLGDGA